MVELVGSAVTGRSEDLAVYGVYRFEMDCLVDWCRCSSVQSFFDREVGVRLMVRSERLT